MIESHPPRGVGSRFLHPLAIASVCVTFATCVTCLICPTGATAAGLQIKGLSDPRGPVAGRSQSRAPLRVSDGFCVISEARAAVQLAFSNSHGPAGDGPCLRAGRIGGFRRTPSSGCRPSTSARRRR